MGRLWLGLGILAVFLGLGLYVGAAAEGTHQQISGVLEQAAQEALAGDLEAGVALAQQAHHRWQKNWHSTAAVADHAPMDEIDGIFNQAFAFAESGRAGDFAACCARLSGLVAAVGEAHSLSWWNLL